MADNALTNDDHNDRLRKEIYDLALNPDRDQTTIHNNGQATFSNRGYFGLAHGHAGEDTHEEEQRDQDKKSKIFRDNMQAMCSIAEINDSFTYDEPEWQTWDDLVRAQPNTFGDDGFSCTYTPEEEQTPQNDGTYGAVNLSSSEQVILNSATSINGLNEIIADVTSDPLIKTD
ncbi:MAG TPA: hypothetical protein PLK94_05750, partial [Alphaproteobacteria bacterium]|nr:hypothetical protein [Alphaproteobacteria bacterium]